MEIAIVVSYFVESEVDKYSTSSSWYVNVSPLQYRGKVQTRIPIDSISLLNFSEGWPSQSLIWDQYVTVLETIVLGRGTHQIKNIR